MERTTPTVPEPSANIDIKLAAIGVVGGIAAAMMMDTFSRLMRRYNAVPHAGGLETKGHGSQPPQAEGAGQEGGPEPDATEKVGTAVFRSVAGYTPGAETREWLGTAAHYAFSAAVGVNYMLASEQAPELRRGFGTVYGSLVWATADEGAIPALGLSKAPDQIPLGVHAYALGAHWVYGATLEAFRRIASSVLTAWEDSRGIIDTSAAEA